MAIYTASTTMSTTTPFSSYAKLRTPFSPPRLCLTPITLSPITPSPISPSPSIPVSPPFADLKELIIAFNATYDRYVSLILNDPAITVAEIRNSLVQQLRLERHYLLTSRLNDSNGVTNEVLCDIVADRVPRMVTTGAYDPGHGLNNIRLAWVYNLWHAHKLNRTLVFSNTVQAAAWRLIELLKLSPPPNFSFQEWPVEDIVDMKAISEYGGGFSAMVMRELPEWMQKMPRVPAMPSVTIWGSPTYRRFYQWPVDKTQAVLANYKGIFANLPYFFCDKHTKVHEAQMLQANSLIGPNKQFFSAFVDPVLRFLHGNSTKPRQFVAIHIRASPIYNQKLESAPFFSMIDEAITKALGQHRASIALYIASDNSALFKKYFEDLGYLSLVTKEDVLTPGSWDAPLVGVTNQMLSLKATMIDLEVAARANIFFGTTQSSFSRVIASQRYEKQLRRQQQQQQPAPVYKTMRYNQLCSPTTVKCTEEKLANEIGEFCTPDDASACFYQC